VLRYRKHTIIVSDPFKISVSKAKTYSACNKQYNYSYNLKLPQKERDFHVFGKFVHQVLEDFHQAYITGCLLQPNIVMADAFNSATKKYVVSKEAKDEAYEIIDKYLQRLTKNKKELKSVSSVEKHFSINISDNIILNGMIDRIQMDDDNIIHVADYKTTKNKKYLKNDWFQLLTYAYVILLENPNVEKIRGSYILLRHNFEYITKEFSKKEILSIKDQFEDYAKNIAEDKLWRASPTRLCGWCSFLDICEEGKEFMQPTNVKFGAVEW
jgi:putative RecB family exonuclease